MTDSTRRNFLTTAASTSALLGLGDSAFLSRLQAVSRAEAQVNPSLVRLDAGIEPLVRLLEETPRERALEEVAARIKRGVTYKEVVAAVQLAGVRNVQPRPSVGFKFHCVLVVNSAHLAALASPDSERWLPILWAIDNFKSSQATDAREGDWWMKPVNESAVPTPEKARAAFASAMDNWDEAAADTAAAGIARTLKPQEVFEIFARYGMRDFRDIGHKAIYVANAWRTLNVIGWQHSEPILRSLAYALLKHEQGNPATNDFSADRPGKRNAELAKRIRIGWLTGKPNDDATRELLSVLRTGSDADASALVVELLNRGAAPQSIWDAILSSAAELIMRQPAIVALHAATTTNALRFAFETSQDDETRRLALLQNAAFVTLFRGALPSRGTVAEARIENLEPAKIDASAQSVEQIVADFGRDRAAGAGKALGFLKAGGAAKSLIDAGRLLVFFKGTDSHDYKYSSAIFEDYARVAPAWRDRYLAACTYLLKGSAAADNRLVQRIRAALG